jgi:putative nucleotidyltransferase-like protein
MADLSAADALEAVCARLRGESVPLSAATVEAAREHRVHLLLADSLSPPEQRLACVEELQADLRRQAILDAVRERELRRLIEAFTAARIETLLFKGAGLAYTVYRAPHLRPRVDLDVLIPPERLAGADRLLTSEGWTRAVEPDTLLTSAQRHYKRRSPAGLTEQLDLHWKIANPRLFGNAIAFEDLWARAVPVPIVGGNARTLSCADALLTACVHRVAHHDDALDLLWLWDIHLLASRLSPDEAAGFIDLAARTRMRAVCARGLGLAAERFHTPGAPALAGALEERPAAAEPSARFVGGGLSMLDLLYADLAATLAWGARVTLIREHLFPSLSYMRSVYARWPAALLPLAYAHRILRGAPKWFRRPAPGGDR